MICRCESMLKHGTHFLIGLVITHSNKCANCVIDSSIIFQEQRKQILKDGFAPEMMAPFAQLSWKCSSMNC